jgi:hypothetical protein
MFLASNKQQQGTEHCFFLTSFFFLLREKWRKLQSDCIHNFFLITKCRILGVVTVEMISRLESRTNLYLQTDIGVAHLNKLPSLLFLLTILTLDIIPPLSTLHDIHT